MPFEPTHRRAFLAGCAIAATLPALASCGNAPAHARAKGKFRISKTETEWRADLTREQYYILRDAGTEYAWSSSLNDEKREGVYACAGCDNKIYASAHKYDSKSGWPSFYQPHDKGSVETSVDYVLGYPRTEVHCADCGGHLGHIFSDGPEPTGERHCINGVAMKFIPA
ncbi:MAG: peptide-methionine (R)-S-oxide reductase MsrB [Erythrobacter sp.]